MIIKYRIYIIFIIVMLAGSISSFAQDYLIITSNGDTIAACAGNFYDSGSNIGNYSDNEKYSVTFHAPAGERIIFDFTSLELRNEGGDTLRIFDGMDTLSTVIGTYTGESLSFTVASSDSALTFQFTSDGSLNNSGWEASISCCLSPGSSIITGSDTVCAKTSGSKYFIDGGVASTYEWFINGGSIVSGTGTDTIYVDWGSAEMDTYVKVVEDNGCMKSDTIQLDVRINALPVVSFTGLDSVYQITDSPVTLSGNPVGGTFSGNGITGDQFDPNSAGIGTHEIVYTYLDANSCANSDTQYVDVRDFDDKDGAIWLTDLNSWCSTDAQYTSIGATADEPASTCNDTGPNNNVWFKFQATTNAITIDVKTGGSFGTMERQQINLWNSNGDIIQCCGTGGGWDWQGTKQISIDTLTIDHVYWISVDHVSGLGGQAGSFSLCINDEASYDYRSGALKMNDLKNYRSLDAEYSTENASGDEIAPFCNSSGPNNNVWFKFQATTNAITANVITGGSYGTMRRQQINLWNEAGDLIKCVGTGGGWNWQGTLELGIDTLTVGSWYWISVDHVSGIGGQAGTFTLCLDEEATYDYKSAAVELTDLTSWCSADAAYTTQNATPDEPATSCNSTGPNNNVWFKFQANTNAISIDVKTGESYGTMKRQQINLWNESGDLIKCVSTGGGWNWQGTLELGIDTLTVGNWYYISVDHISSIGGEKGTFTLCVDNDPTYDFKSGAFELQDISNWCSSDAAFSTLNATPDEPATSCNSTGPNKNVWFKFQATTTGIAIDVKTGGSFGTMKRQQINLWTEDGTLVKCVGTGGGWNWQGTRTLSLDTLTIGDWYYISVDHISSIGGQAGTFTLCIDDTPTYDFLSGAKELVNLNNWCSSDAQYTTADATPDEPATLCNSSGPNNNVWFKFDATTTDITVKVKTGGSYGTMVRQQINLWNETGDLIKCIGTGGGWNWQGTLILSLDTLTVGNWYYVSVDHIASNGGQKGTFTLCIDDAPAYDYKSSAHLLPLIDNWCSSDAAYSTQNATPDEPATPCNTTGPNNNVWFQFVATTNSVTIDVKTGGTYGTMERQQINLWDESGNLVKCTGTGGGWYWQGTKTLTIDTLTVGHTYYISVDHISSNGGEKGSFTLCIDDAPAYDQKAGAIELTDLSNWCSSDAEFSTVDATPDEAVSSCNTTGPNNNVWFKFQATTNSITVDVKTGGSFGTMERQQINLWNESGNLVKCTGTGGGWYWQGTVTMSIDTLTTGNWYWISVDHISSNGGQTGSFTLCIDDEPNYDYLSGALELTDIDNWTSADAIYSTNNATPDEAASPCNSTGPNNNVWFKFQATTNSTTIKVLTGGSYGTMKRQQVNLWNSSSNLVKCTGTGGGWYWQGTITMSIDTLTIGDWYWISVDHISSNGGQKGTFTLYVDDGPEFDYKVGAIELTDLDNWCSSNAEYSTSDASPDEASTSCNTTGPNTNVWFKFKALTDTATIDVITGGAFGTMERQQINVWNESGNMIQCVGTGGGWNWQGTVSITIDTLTVGKWYWISVDYISGNGGQTGTFSLCINNTEKIFYSRADGNWKEDTVWSNIGHTGAPASSIPGPGDVVRIQGHQIIVDTTASAAALYITIDDNHTILDIDSGVFNVNGQVIIENSGINYDGKVFIRNNSSFSINNDLSMNRNGGDNLFEIEITDSSTLDIGQNFNCTSTGGTTIESTVNLNNKSQLTIGNDLLLNSSGGPKFHFTLSDTSKIIALRNIGYSAISDNSLEIELNDTSSIEIAKDFTRGTPAYGSLTCLNNSVIIFNGISYLQTLPENAGEATDEFTYQNIIIQNQKITTPQISLEGPVSINGTLQFIDGIVQSTSSNLLTIENTANVNGASDTSYIDGPVEKIGNTSFMFPVGDNGVYHPLTITAPTNPTDAFIAEYFFTNPHPTYNKNLKESSIKNISNKEYWNIERSAGSSDIAVTLTFSDSSTCIYELDSIDVINWDGSQWNNYGNGGTTGISSSGTITSNSLINLDNNILTIGNSLPDIEIIGLDANYCGSADVDTITGIPTDSNGSFSGTGINDLGNGTAVFDPSIAGSGEHIINYTYLNICENSLVDTTTVYTLPTSTVLGSDTICEGSSTEISIYFSGQAPWDFTYTNGTDTLSSSTSNNPYNIEVSEPGSYHVIALTDGNGCFGSNLGDTAFIGIYKTEKPVIVTGGPTTFCEGDTLMLTATPVSNDYFWSTGDHTQSIEVTETNTYVVQIIDTNNCVSAYSDPVDVTVNPLPFRPGKPKGDEAVCQNTPPEEYITTGSLYSEPDEYEWFVNPSIAGIITGNTTTGNMNWDSGFSGSAYISVRGHNSCGYGPISDSILITVESSPAVDLGNDTTVCAGFILDAGNSGADYFWVTGETTQTISADTSGTYWVNVTSGNGCEGTDTINITVSTPEPTIQATPNPSCYGTGNIQLEIVEVFSDYIWSPADSLVGSGDSQIEQYIPYGNPAAVSMDVMFYVTVTDGIGCQANDSIQITINRRPETGPTYHISNDWNE